MPTKLFVSYRSLDSSRVDSVVTRLRSLKNPDGSPVYDVWQDKTSIPIGQDWWRAIIQGIVDCDVFVFMISKLSVQSVNCQAELGYARRRNRPIIPFVLEGEFQYNPLTGKNDIDFWQYVPDQLVDGRFQYLFYEGAAWLDQFNQAAKNLLALGLRDMPALEPPDPRNSDDTSNDTTLIYDRACDYAWRMEFKSAEKFFQRLIDLRDPLFSDDAHEWILLLRDYEQIVRLDEHVSAHYKIPALWQNYAKRFPKPFTQLFDPRNFLFAYGNPVAPPPFESFKHDMSYDDSAVYPILEPTKTYSSGVGSQPGFPDLFADIFSAFGSDSNRLPGDNSLEVTVSLEQAFQGTVVPLTIKRLELCDICNGSGGKTAKPRKIACPTCSGIGYVFQNIRDSYKYSGQSKCPQCHGIGKIANPSCDNCGGIGLISVDSLIDLIIPPGIQDGSHIQLKGVGDVDLKSKAKLDLYVRVRVETNADFRVSGSNLWTREILDDSIAFTGGTIDVKTIEGVIRMRIPNGTSDRQVFRLRGKGMPKLNSDGSADGRADQLIEVRLSSKIGPLLKQTLSVETFGDIATPLIKRGVELPTENTQVFSTATDNQTQVEIHICCGESAVASENLSLGKFLLDGIPKAPKGVPQIRVTFSVDTANRLYVTAKDASTGYYKTLNPIELDKLADLL